jgi:hypothetical protein
MASFASTTAAVPMPLPLPVWANAANRALHQRIEHAALQLKDTTSVLNDDAARADAMREALHQLSMQLRGCQV